MKKYTKPETIQFVEDMHEAYYDVEHYHGRFYWEGPAVRAKDATELADIVGSTSVKLQWDNLGLGYIIYPLVPDEGKEIATAGN